MGAAAFAVVLVVASHASGARAAPPAAAAETATIAAAAIEPVRHAIRDLAAGFDDETRRFYERRDFEPAWLNTERRSVLAGIIARAVTEHGFDAALPTRWIAEPEGATPSAAARRDVELTRAALRHVNELATGRGRPAQFETDWAIAAPTIDAPAGLHAALREGRLLAWTDGLAPGHVFYKGLQTALARYRDLARAGGWPTVPRGEPLRPGMTDPRIAVLRQRLLVEGDLPASEAAPSAALPEAPRPETPADVVVIPLEPTHFFDPELERALRRFQARVGIVPDGVVGPRTLAALNVPAQSRVEQIALNLERWRALPRDFGRNAIVVNAPGATLDVIEDGASVLRMKTVVGTPDTPTPVVQTSLSGVVLNPFWTIPASIYTNEILPKLRRDAGYLAKNQMVRTEGKGLQQLPGPKNPLGVIKFETPNRFDVYLHDTPSKATFERAVRAASHGCVRVENAKALAVHLLASSGVAVDEIERRLASGETQRIEVKRRWRVSILYATAFADTGGPVNFRDDLYGRDKRLRAALAGDAVGSAARLRVSELVPPTR